MLGGGPLLEPNPEGFISLAWVGMLYASQNLFIFLFAAVGLDYRFKTNLLSPFPVE